MSDIMIKAVESEKELEQFIELPWTIYRNDPNWVPPLITEQKKMLDTGHNPFFQHARASYFLASRNGECLGRISAHIDDNSNKFHSEKCGFFGFFECRNDQPVAAALFAAAEKWIKAQGMDAMRGPFNFTTNDTAGLLVDAFNLPPVIEMTYNPPYYPALVESCGYAKIMDMWAYFLDVQNIDRRRIKMLARRAEQKGITFRSVNKKVFEQEVKIFKEVYNQAWSQNWGFIPLTEAEIDHYAKSFKDIVEPDYVIFAFDGEKPVGSLWALPDYNYALKRLNGKMGPWEIIKFLWHKRQITHTRVMTAGVIKDYQKRGIEAGLVSRVIENAVKKGTKTGELSWVLENNLMMNRLGEAVGARVYKTYRVYEKRI